MADLSKFNYSYSSLFPYYYDLRETEPRLKAIRVKYRSGTLNGGKSPWINGKLVLRANPLRQVVRQLYTMKPAPTYVMYGGVKKVTGYYTVSPDVSMRVDNELVMLVQNLAREDLVSGLRDAKINISLHLAEFFKNLSWFEKRLNDAAQLVSAILTKKGRLELMQDALSKDQKRFQRIKNIFLTHGTLPRSFHDDPRYFDKKKRRLIVRDMQTALNNRDKTLHKEMADLTLEYSYAVNPIAQDVYKLATKIDNFDFQNLPIKISKTRVSENTYTSDTGINQTRYTTTTKVRCRISGFVGLVDTRLNTLEQFGFSNLPALVWELTWASFVLDWALPIGTWLNQFHALDGWSVKDLNTTTTTKAFCTGEHLHSGASGTGGYLYKIREVGSVPGYRLRLLNPFTSLRRGLNQAALAVSVGSKR